MAEAKDLRSMGESRRVPLSGLRLDPLNPRIPDSLHGRDQEEIAIHVELAFDALTVGQSIASHGFFPSEPLIVIADDGDGDWTVIEGNRRLTALLGLVDAATRAAFANPSPWDELAARATVEKDDLVPVVVLPNRRAATPIIGYRHISGILQWQPYAQARYIARLVDVDGMAFGEVSEMTGIDRTRVANLYRDQAIAAQARALGIETGPMEDSFSLLTVAMSTPRLRDHIGAPLGSKLSPGEDPIPPEMAANLRELVAWIYGDGETEPLIGDSREISKLGNVVASETGLASLRAGDTLEIALQRVKEAGVDPRQRLVNRLRTGRNSLHGAVEDIADFGHDVEVRELVEEARAAAEALATAFVDD